MMTINHLHNLISQYLSWSILLAQQLPLSINSNNEILMQVPSIVNQNLYEIPSCSICLNQLTDDLSSLACGHVFHIDCITQHFEYKGTCPNCQKRAQLKEIRLVVYPVTKNTNSGKYLSTLLESLDKSQGQQTMGLLKQVKILSEKNEKLTFDLKEAEKEMNKKIELYQKIKREMTLKTVEYEHIRKQNANLTQQLNIANNQRQKNQIDLIQLRQRHDSLLSMKKQMQQFRILQKIASDNSEDLIRYRKQLQNKQTSAQSMSKQFFEMLQIKNLNILKMKQKQKQYIQKYKIKDDETNKLKLNIQQLKKQLQSTQSQVNKWKNKHDKVKDKYRDICQKIKKENNIGGGNNCEGGGNQEIIEENSMSVSMGFINRGVKKQVIVATEKQLGFNLAQKPKSSQQKYIGGTILKKVAEQKKQLSLKNFMV